MFSSFLLKYGIFLPLKISLFTDKSWECVCSISPAQEKSEGFKCPDIIFFSIFQTRMETTFGPAFSAVTTITKREYFRCTVSPQSTVCDPRVVVVVLQIIKLLGESGY